jgi:hypothetical protein
MFLTEVDKHSFLVNINVSSCFLILITNVFIYVLPITVRISVVGIAMMMALRWLPEA